MLAVPSLDAHMGLAYTCVPKNMTMLTPAAAWINRGTATQWNAVPCRINGPHKYNVEIKSQAQRNFVTTFILCMLLLLLLSRFSRVRLCGTP